MTFKAKPFKLGNSRAIYIPKSIYKDLEDGKVYTFEVITGSNVYTVKAKMTKPVYTEKKKSFDTAWCNKHDSMKGTCGCK